MDKILPTTDTPTKELWEQIKAIKINHTKSKISTIKIPTIAVTDKEKANAFGKYFYEVCPNTSLGEQERQRREKYADETKELQQEQVEDFYKDANITIDEVTSSIKEKDDTAAGSDILNFTILKRIPMRTIKTVTALFNKI